MIWFFSDQQGDTNNSQNDSALRTKQIVPQEKDQLECEAKREKRVQNMLLFDALVKHINGIENKSENRLFGDTFEDCKNNLRDNCSGIVNTQISTSDNTNSDFVKSQKFECFSGSNEKFSKLC